MDCVIALHGLPGIARRSSGHRGESRSRFDGPQPQHRAAKRVGTGGFEREKFHADQTSAPTAFVGVYTADANPLLAPPAVDIDRQQAHGPHRERFA
jgi:hypothetical protein